MNENEHPWLELHNRLEEATTGEALQELLDELPAGELARTVDRLGSEDQAILLDRLGPEHASQLLEDLSNAQAVDLIEHLEPEQAADIVEALHSDTRADVLGSLLTEQAEAILEDMEPVEAAEARELLAYPEDSAGGLMQTELLSYRGRATVKEVIEDLRSNAQEYSDFEVQYAYVVDAGKHLIGVLRMRDLLLSPPATKVRDLMIKEPAHVNHHAPLADLRSIFDEKDYIALPVVDNENVLLGAVLGESVQEATSEEAAEDFLKIAGLSGREELRSMPLRLRSRRRLSWLSINILLNVMAASIIAFFQETLSQVIALAVFLPIISDMSGCSGSQAVAVSIRELTLGLVRPSEIFRTLLKELSVGLVNGLALGLLLATVALLWKGNPWLGLVVGGALMLNTIVAVCLGGMIPLLLKRANLDPALASGPILTTVTDMCGFLLVLGFATLMLNHLV